MEEAVVTKDKPINLKHIDVFQRYYLHMFPELKYFTCKYIDDEEVVADLIQDVWLKLWEQKLTFPTEVALKSYLYRTLHNEALNYLRSCRREQERYEALTDESETEDNRTVLHRMIEAEVYAMLNEAFSELPESCRRVYAESLKGKSQKEIAAQLNISVNTVKKHINHANHLLKERLEKLLALLALFQ